MTNILITTFGATWQIVPELLGFTNPELVDLYAHHPQLEAIERSRLAALILPVDEVWLITTKGDKTDQSVGSLFQWRECMKDRAVPSFRVWQVADAEDLASEAECRRMAECIFRLVLHASERKAMGQLVISLAGGRKTMSSDIQNAAACFGCHALLHVIQNENYSQPLKAYGPKDFIRPLPEFLKDAVTPLVAGRYERNPIVDLAVDGPIRAEHYEVPFPEDFGMGEIRVGGESLVADVRDRQEKAGFLYCNYANRLMYEETSTNFLALYNLRPAMIDRLKSYKIGSRPEKYEDELRWLKRLPKAELHCHLGGIADIRELIQIAATNLDLVDDYREPLSGWLNEWRKKLDRGLVDRIDFKQLRKAVPGVPEPVCTAAFVLLFEDSPDLLDEIVFGPYRSEAGFCGIGFETYEALGDLQGSGLLQSEQSLRAACRILMHKAADHNVKYLEMRCSPANYTSGDLKAIEVARIIDRELSSGDHCNHALIFIASRHGKMSRVHEHIELAQELMGEDGAGFGNFRGFDLAGNEKAGNAVLMREAFMPMMEKCLHFTIHAGEIQDVGSIWEAVYHLNAERIGHGLTLKDNPDLLEKFRDRNIAIEMCPSSNFQIVGFRDSCLPSTNHLATYPLKEYLDQGLRVTVNTDNPGISRTDFTNELHRAARLTPGGLSIWDMLLLIRNGFKAGFSQRALRQQMIREAEAEILDLIQEWSVLKGMNDEKRMENVEL
ncbi:MAG: CRISPR-associated ring nuclease [Desulfatiglandales bacterium]